MTQCAHITRAEPAWRALTQALRQVYVHTSWVCSSRQTTHYGAPEGASQVLQHGAVNTDPAVMSGTCTSSVITHAVTNEHSPTQPPHISASCVPQPLPSPCCAPAMQPSVTSLQHSHASALVVKNKCTALCALTAVPPNIYVAVRVRTMGAAKQDSCQGAHPTQGLRPHLPTTGAQPVLVQVVEAPGVE